MEKNVGVLFKNRKKKMTHLIFFFGTKGEVVSEAANRQSASFDWMLTVARTRLKLQYDLEEQK